MTESVVSNRVHMSWQPQGGIATAVRDQVTTYYPKTQLPKTLTHLTTTFSEDGVALAQLDNDISTTMRERVLAGYLMNCQQNIDVVKEDTKLREIWRWTERAVELNSKSSSPFNAMDYNLRGVYHICMGSGQQGRKSSPSSTPRPNMLTPQKRPSASRKKETQSVLPSHEQDTQPLYMIPSTSKGDQRKLALATCGFDMTKEQLENVLASLEAEGEYDKAAAWAIFNGLTERAIDTLSNTQSSPGEEGQYKMMSIVLAGYQINSEPSPGWRRLCESMAKDLTHKPYLRAIFEYIATNNWDEVLSDAALSLQERVAIALRFLDDDQLGSYLTRMMDNMISEGNIEGLILTGLSTRGMDLLERMINRTGDIQTAALLVSFVVPRRLQDSRAEEWIESYRCLLDRWQFWHQRAKFDIEHGKYMNASEDIASPQVYVRCTYCAQTLGHSLLVQNLRSRDGKRMNVQANISPASGSRITGKQKATVCPSCRKPLPRCALCLLHMGTPIDSARQAMATNNTNNDDPASFDLWFTWCQTCRHGGHAFHMFDWFQKHSSCPVSNCACQCQIFTE